jgi:hypothetical protein
MSGAVEFKKRRRVNNPRTSTTELSVRKTDSNESGDVDDEEQQASEALVLSDADAIEDARILQEERKRRRGGIKRSTVDEAANSSAPTSAEVAAVVTKEGMFTNTFERQTDAPDQASKIEKLMDQYVNEQLAAEKRKWQQQALAKRGVETATTTTVASVTSVTTTSVKTNDVDSKQSVSIDAELYAMLPDASAVARGAIAGNWATGIEEVELPIEYKMRNIEETAKATQALAHRPHHPRKAEQPPLNFSSYSASFSKYHANANNSTLVQSADETAVPTTHATTSTATTSGAPKKQGRSTDFQAMSKFKANMRR